jgi:hypothetical protein
MNAVRLLLTADNGDDGTLLPIIRQRNGSTAWSEANRRPIVLRSIVPAALENFAFFSTTFDTRGATVDGID